MGRVQRLSVPLPAATTTTGTWSTGGCSSPLTATATGASAATPTGTPPRTPLCYTDKPQGRKRRECIPKATLQEMERQIRSNATHPTNSRRAQKVAKVRTRGVQPAPLTILCLEWATKDTPRGMRDEGLRNSTKSVRVGVFCPDPMVVGFEGPVPMSSTPT